MAVGVLVDLNRCIGCRSCQVACKAWNDNPGEETECVGYYDNPPNLDADTWSIIQFNEVEVGGRLHWVFAKRQCMHCEEPACASACPVGALHKLNNGAVVYDSEKCIGCRYCMMACPFRVPKFQWNTPVPLIRKCTLCVDRLTEGDEPACVKACPTGALTFGDRNELIAEAHRRIQARPGKYVDHVYGEHEVGGTSWLYISPVPFDEIGFPTLDSRPVTVPSQTAMEATPGVFVGVVALMGGIRWFTQRRSRAKDQEAVSVPKGKEE